jgi:hypothetical protein
MDQLGQQLVRNNAAPVRSFLRIARLCILDGLAISLVAALAACSPSVERMPPNGDYLLMWYDRPGTDYGPIVPGFQSLEMCRRAGVGMTMQKLIRDRGYQDGYVDDDKHPWFECGATCRPLRSGEYLLVCKHIQEFRGVNARLPRL